MKLSATIITCCLVLSLLSGCQDPRRGVEVIIDGAGQFPDELVGKWVDQKEDWEFVFEPDGRISTSVIALGKVRIVPGEVTRFPTRFGGKGIFEPGLWTVTYHPEGRELAVEVVIEYFLQDVGNHSMEGHTRDLLVGPVSEDGRRWDVDLFSSGKIEALIYDGWTLIERKEILSFDEPTSRGSLIFEKEE